MDNNGLTEISGTIVPDANAGQTVNRPAELNVPIQGIEHELLKDAYAQAGLVYPLELLGKIN